MGKVILSVVLGFFWSVFSFIVVLGTATSGNFKDFHNLYDVIWGVILGLPVFLSMILYGYINSSLSLRGQFSSLILATSIIIGSIFVYLILWGIEKIGSKKKSSRK